MCSRILLRISSRKSMRMGISKKEFIENAIIM